MRLNWLFLRYNLYLYVYVVHQKPEKLVLDQFIEAYDSLILCCSSYNTNLYILTTLKIGTTILTQ